MNLAELPALTRIDPSRTPLSEAFDLLGDLTFEMQQLTLEHIQTLDPSYASALKQLLENDRNLVSESPLPTIPAQAIAAAQLPAIELNPNIKLLELIGEGGMGEVWKARRRLQAVSSDHGDAELEQLVAIKLLKNYTRNEQARARFRGEQEHLIKLAHPNIARLLDAGESSAGVPWIALELVEGLPITRWCDQNKSTITQRLGLFLQVCTAVQFAHEHFIIHRDIKPSNVLVDRHGQVKLLDFGIAKSSESKSLTGTHDQLFSIYAVSPEQLSNEPVSSATDCYALGALLYELLCGAPLLPESVSTPAALEHFVVHTSPAAPSSRARAEAATLRKLASREELSKALRGDLDKIVLHALRKRATERYRSVQQLAQDIDAAIHQRPVSAVGQSAGYRAQKFLRRHWLAVGASAIALSALVGLTVQLYLRGNELARSRDTALQAQSRAETAQNNSEQVNLFLLKLFKQANPLTSDDPTATMEELIAQGMQEALRKDSAMHQNFDVQLGLLQAANAFGVDTQRTSALLDSIWTKRMALSLAQQQQLIGAALNASTNGIDQTMLRIWGERAETSLKQNPDTELSRVYGSAKAAIAFSNGDFKSAVALTEIEPMEPHLVSIRGVALAFLGETKRAEQLIQTSIDAAGREQRWLSSWYGALSQVQGMAEKSELSNQNAKKALEAAVQQFGENGAQTLIARNDYATSALTRGDFDTAGVEFSRLLTQMQLLGIDDDRLLFVQYNRLLALSKKGALAKADVRDLESIAALQKTPGNLKLGCRLALVRYHAGQGDFQGARGNLRLALALSELASPLQKVFLDVWQAVLLAPVKTQAEVLELAKPITSTDKQMLALLYKTYAQNN